MSFLWHYSKFAACVGVALAALLVLGAGEPAAEEDPLKQYEEKTDRAVDLGLKFLASQQQNDGTFRGKWTHNTGIASLCVMAFLARGYTPGTGPHGEVINKGIDYVLSAQNKDGMLLGREKSHGGMYSHSISTLLLSEVSGMVDGERQKKIDEALPKALQIILSAQKLDKNNRFDGGWRYNSNSRDSDISCTGWPLMALRSARNNGAAVPKDAIENGLKFVLNCRSGDGGFAYQPGSGSGVARTGTALLCLELCGMHESKEAQGAAEYLLKHGHDNSWFYYGIYYCAQGMYQIGGRYWQEYGPSIFKKLLERQSQDGSWPDNSGGGGRAGKSYSTAMSVLALSVPYCQLPIYQR